MTKYLQNYAEQKYERNTFVFDAIFEIKNLRRFLRTQ